MGSCRGTRGAAGRPVGVEAVQRVGAVAGRELAAEVADVQAAFLAQAQAAAPRRVLVREQRARLLGGQELLVRLLSHSGAGRGGWGAARRRAPHARSDPATNAAMSGRSRDALQAHGRRDEPLPAPTLGSGRLQRPLPRRRPARPAVGRRSSAAMAAAVGKSAAVVYGHGENGSGRGGGSFLGPRVPAEVEAMARGVQELGKETFRRLLKGRTRAWPSLGVQPCPGAPRPAPFPRRGGTGGVS